MLLMSFCPLEKAKGSSWFFEKTFLILFAATTKHVVTHGWGVQWLGRVGRELVWWAEKTQEAPLQTLRSSPESDHTGLTEAVRRNEG